jgi:trehalose/maltose hydrolase-like predicted phosphorylase
MTCFVVFEMINNCFEFQNVNNSVYTNLITKISLDFAILASNLTGGTYPPAWQQISSNMKIPFDPVNNRHPEYDGYVGHMVSTQITATPLTNIKILFLADQASRCCITTLSTRN